jgi:aldehyde:ferredoxin oxidoreductase
LDKKYHDAKRRKPCEGCVISCAWTFKNPTFQWAPAEQTGEVALPEYETLGLIGGNLGIDNPLGVIHANHLCNILGLDTISAGNVIGFLMELSQHELLPRKLRDAKIEFGDVDSVLKLLPKIANRDGIGDRLAQGTRQFAFELGKDAHKVALHTKGLEFPAWDPRGKLGLGLSYVTAAAGASHLRGWPSTTKPPNASAASVLDSLVEQQNLKVIKDSMVICHFTHSISPRLGLKDCAEILSTVTGIETTVDSVNQVADRIWLLARLFNNREYDDAPRQYDVLPYRFMNEPIPDGPTKGFTAFISSDDFEESLTELYKRRGCDPEGRPTNDAIQKLGLADITA